MTKKHFVALADALKKTRPSVLDDEINQWEADVLAVGMVLQDMCPKFDTTRFLNYVGITT